MSIRQIDISEIEDQSKNSGNNEQGNKYFEASKNTNKGVKITKRLRFEVDGIK